ncbi:hypothetical protein ILUMI_04348 [Ignelater luminosus]|uniref:Fanconi anemia group I protein n=1 Tax=Ignelater luminosus TaxID=2038154 RepID=A0A8K0DEX6_IGNLU|nr:hypothetical protein ILUMI_04348 [Ignelater luminosus]
MTEIENKVREYGQKADREGLKQYVESLDADELVEMTCDRINNPNFVHTWNYIMQAFTDSSESHRKRFKLVSALLQELEKGLLPSSQSSRLITRTCVELPKFKSQHLISLCNYCIECIQKGKVTEMCWKEILPEILNVLVEIELLEHNDSEMTGLEYKAQLVNSLCMLVWSPDIVTSLTSMFIDMPLNKEEHLQVVNKLGQYMEKLTCQEIPAFVYQLLKLCRYQNSRSIFLRLQYYFGTRVYSRLHINQEANSDSTNVDVIGDAADEEAVEVESTVLYHIYESASVGHECIKDYLTSLKNMIKSPEFILHPFQFTVLLTISSISALEERVMEILRLGISRAIQEEHRKIDSCWFRDMVPNTCKIEDILRQIIDCCTIADRHLVVQGLVQLAYILLGVNAMLIKDGTVIAEKHWQLGKIILLKIIKKKRHVAPFIITSLSNRIVTGQNAFQYIDCVLILSQKMSLIMLENQSCIIELVEYLVQVPGPVANNLLDAILPLTKVSPTIRDHLILLLRKALYSRITETRQMAVSGFLKLIKNLKISNLAALSQSSSSSSFSSGHSLLTQASLNCTGRSTSNAFSNEALCLEVLGILRRCFMQQAEVRAQLYDGLYDAVCMNPELGIPVLDVIWIHFNNLYVTDENTLPPLDFSKVTVTHELDVKLQDDGTDLLDVIPESQQKLLVLKEALSVYEALIGYKICSWGPQSEDNGQQISNLFQSYSRLMDFAKNLLKPKKSDKRKKKGDANKTTQSSQNTSKVDGTPKSKSFKLPKTILDFQTIGKILHLLHKSEVAWANADQANIIKRKLNFHRHIMNATIQLVQRLKSLKTTKAQHTKMYYNYVTEIAGILYERCIARLNEFIDFDCTTAILSLECFHLILVVISNHYRSNLPTFLCVVAGKSKDEDLLSVLTVFVETYKKLFEMDESELSTDPEIKRMSLLLLEWLKNIMNNNTMFNKQVACSFISLAFNTQIKFKTSINLFESVALRLSEVMGTINEDKPNAEEPKIIDNLTASGVFPLLCSSIKTMLDDVDWIIVRLRSEHGMISYPGEANVERRREYLKSKERGVCCQLCPIITILGVMCNITIPPGNQLEALFKNITHLYNSLNALTKYFILRSSKINLVFQGARFERVARLAGKQLSSIVYDFIIYFEESQKQDAENTQTKKKSVDTTTLKSKVLRETRLIPKTIYEIEQFGKSVIQLSNKTKVDLTKFVGQGTARDFRIKGLKEVLQQIGNETNVTIDDDSASGGDISVESESNMETDDVFSERETGDSGDEMPPPPPKKKVKK